MVIFARFLAVESMRIRTTDWRKKENEFSSFFWIIVLALKLDFPLMCGRNSEGFSACLCKIFPFLSATGIKQLQSLGSCLAEIIVEKWKVCRFIGFTAQREVSLHWRLGGLTSLCRISTSYPTCCVHGILAAIKTRYSACELFSTEKSCFECHHFFTKKIILWLLLCRNTIIDVVFRKVSPKPQKLRCSPAALLFVFTSFSSLQ